MDINKAIYNRRSVRKFTDKKIEKEKILKIIDAANQAPSACDIQGWRFIVINKKKLIERLVNQGAASFIKNAPLGILVLYDNRSDEFEYLDYIQSASAAIQNMLLKAVELGLGSCWVCHLPPKKQIRKLFNIPEYYDPIAYIPLGYYTSKPKKRPRKHKVEEIISDNYFIFNKKNTIGKNIKLIFKKKAKKLYYSLPLRKYIKPFVDFLFEKRFN